MSATGIVTRQGGDPQGLRGEAIEPGPGVAGSRSAGVSPGVIQQEIEHAQEAERVLNQLGRACVRPNGPAEAEADMERAAIVSENAPMVACSGLVSVPTTQKRTVHTPFRVLAERTVLNELLSAFNIDTEARRLSQLRMNVGVAARGHCVTPTKGGDDCLMVTLTYAGTNEQWEPSHVRTFVDHVRKYLKRRELPCRYVWVAELQKRGVIHYHVALWVPRGMKLPKPDEQGWWPHGMTRIEVARAAVPYLLKYLSKDTSKTFGSFPKGARIYGVGGLDQSMRRTRRWLRLPSFVQGNASIDDDWKRATGGGWTAPDGSHWVSEFARRMVGGVAALVRQFQHPRAIEAAGPFSWFRMRNVPAFSGNR